MTSLIVEVARPRFWSRADGDRLRQWSDLQVSPDDADGYQRHDDRDDQRWDLVATTVSSVGARLAAGAWTPLSYEGEPTCDGRIEVDLPSALTATETDIVCSWFNDAEAVCTGPWDTDLGVQNGRQRLWGVLGHSRDLLMPVRGTSLRYANPYTASEYESRPGNTDRWQSTFTTCLDELYFTDWFDHDDPLNRRFVVALQESARGQWPDPTALSHDTPELLVEPGSTPQPPQPTRLQRIAAWLRGTENHHR